jgi:hypothetical protein
LFIWAGCQQTAHFIAESLGTKFRVVSGLYEKFSRGGSLADLAIKEFGSGRLPPWLSVAECGYIGMAVDMGYMDTSTAVICDEDGDDCNRRVCDTIKGLIDAHSEDDHILFVAHQSTHRVTGALLCAGNVDYAKVKDSDALPTCVTRYHLSHVHPVSHQHVWTYSHFMDVSHLTVIIASASSAMESKARLSHAVELRRSKYPTAALICSGFSTEDLRAFIPADMRSPAVLAPNVDREGTYVEHVIQAAVVLRAAEHGLSRPLKVIIVTSTARDAETQAAFGPAITGSEPGLVVDSEYDVFEPVDRAALSVLYAEAAQDGTEPMRVMTTTNEVLARTDLIASTLGGHPSAVATWLDLNDARSPPSRGQAPVDVPRGPGGCTALQLACREGHHAIAELLLRAGASVGPVAAPGGPSEAQQQQQQRSAWVPATARPQQVPSAVHFAAMCASPALLELALAYGGAKYLSLEASCPIFWEGCLTPEQLAKAVGNVVVLSRIIEVSQHPDHTSYHQKQQQQHQPQPEARMEVVMANQQPSWMAEETAAPPAPAPAPAPPSPSPAAVAPNSVGLVFVAVTGPGEPLSEVDWVSRAGELVWTLERAWATVKASSHHKTARIIAWIGMGSTLMNEDNVVEAAARAGVPEAAIIFERLGADFVESSAYAASLAAELHGECPGEVLAMACGTPEELAGADQLILDVFLSTHEELGLAQPAIPALPEAHHALQERVVVFSNLCEAAKRGSARAITTWVRTHTGKSVDSARGAYETTPLQYACSHGRADAVRTLLDAGAQPLAPNALGATAVHYAAFRRMPAVLDMVMKAVPADQWREALVKRAASRHWPGKAAPLDFFDEETMDKYCPPEESPTKKVSTRLVHSIRKGLNTNSPVVPVPTSPIRKQQVPQASPIHQARRALFDKEN